MFGVSESEHAKTQAVKISIKNIRNSADVMFLSIEVTRLDPNYLNLRLNRSNLQDRLLYFPRGVDMISKANFFAYRAD